MTSNRIPFKFQSLDNPAIYIHLQKILTYQNNSITKRRVEIGSSNHVLQLPVGAENWLALSLQVLGRG